MSVYDHFIYVDASWQVNTGGKKFAPWQRIQVTEVDSKIITPSKNHNCFMSVQRFRDAVSDRSRAKADGEVKIAEDSQIHFCGPYFDFDAKRQEGEQRNQAIARSQADTVKLVRHLMDRFPDMNPAHIQVWFSGGKGFHVLVRPKVFGIQPHPKLTYMIRNVAWSLGDLLELETLDRSVYTISRLWRINNSVHQTTNLRKIELSHHELITQPAQAIMDMAQEARLDPVYDSDEYLSIAPVPEAVAFWNQWTEYFEWQEEMALQSPRKRMERPAGEEGLPVCMTDLWDNGPRSGGKQRNHLSMVMATYFKDMGMSAQDAGDSIDQWTRTHYADRDGRELRENIANGRSAVRSVYADDKYAFTCRSIRACGSKTEGIACSSPDCKWVPDERDQEATLVPTVHLSEASRGSYDGKQLKIPVHVAGKAESPYGLPTNGHVQCPKDPDNRCKFCPLNDPPPWMTVEPDGRTVKWQMGVSTREVLDMVDVPDGRRRSVVKTFARFPHDCHRAKVHYDEMSNLEPVRLVPMVDYSTAFDEDADSVVARSSHHVVRDGYFLGHGLLPNKKYNLTAYTFQHPKDQRIVHLFEEAKPSQNDIERFRLNDEMKKRLEVFRVGAGQTVASKIREIHEDLVTNVHHIRGLENLSEAVDLAFHSVTGFMFDGKPMEKGWFELLVVGDSASGKSTMVKALLHHYRVGELVAGEEAKRSGLVWASMQINGKWSLIWGKIPQNDRRLLVIDEFGDMDQDEVTKLTQLRSEGRAVGQGVSSEYETWARTRLIFLTNVRGSRDLSSYSRGIEAVNSIFKAKADLRRTDLAVTVKKGEVSRAVVSKRSKDIVVPHIYTSDLCHNLVLWAWSRDPKHVEWVGDAEDEVFRLSQEIGERYDSDMYLVESNDMRNKLARVSCAVAARVFSTDERCIKLRVTSAHVRFAADLFDRCYGRNNPKSSMKYHQYAKAWQDRNNLNAQKQAEFKEIIKGFDGNREDVLNALLDINDFRKTDLSDQLAMPKLEFEEFWTFLLRRNLVIRRGNMYRKTGPFNDFLNSLLYNLDFREVDPKAEHPPF